MTPPVADDRGSALVEFVALAVLLLVPLVYVVTTVARVQAAAMAATAAAREAGRAYVTSASTAQADARARAAAALALADQGLEPAPSTLVLTCRLGPCLAPGSRVLVSVRVPVRLPGVPDALGGGGLVIPVRATHVSTVDVHRARR